MYNYVTYLMHYYVDLKTNKNLTQFLYELDISKSHNDFKQ